MGSGGYAPGLTVLLQRISVKLPQQSQFTWEAERKQQEGEQKAPAGMLHPALVHNMGGPSQPHLKAQLRRKNSSAQEVLLCLLFLCHFSFLFNPPSSFILILSLMQEAQTTENPRNPLAFPPLPGLRHWKGDLPSCASKPLTSAFRS